MNIYISSNGYITDIHRKKTKNHKICIEIWFYYTKICIVNLYKSKKVMENIVEDGVKIF